MRPNVPRYVSLKTDEVNLRSGPGVKFPIDWVLKRRNMPVEVLQEFEHWRKVRDWQGTEGWVHQSMLTGKRYGVVTGQIRTLRQKPEREAGPAAQVEAGVVAQILECKDQWVPAGCRRPARLAGAYRILGRLPRRDAEIARCALTASTSSSTRAFTPASS